MTPEPGPGTTCACTAWLKFCGSQARPGPGLWHRGQAGWWCSLYPARLWGEVLDVVCLHGSHSQAASLVSQYPTLGPGGTWGHPTGRAKGPGLRGCRDRDDLVEGAGSMGRLLTASWAGPKGESRGRGTSGPCAQGSPVETLKATVAGEESILQGSNSGDKCQGAMSWVEQTPLPSPSLS